MTHPRHRKVFSILSRIALIIAVMAVIVAGVLELAENSRDALRLGLQDYLTQLAGNPAEITTLEKAELFPKVDFVMKGVVVRDGRNPSRTLATANSLRMSFNVWNIFFGIRRYDVLEGKDVAFATGFVLPQKLTLDFIGIADPAKGDTDPRFLIDGRYNDRDLLITAAMRRHGRGAPSYGFADDIPLNFGLGKTEGSAMFTRGLTGVALKDVDLESGGVRGTFATTRMDYDPFLILFTGNIGDQSVQGRILKENQHIKIMIDEGGASTAGASALKSFVQGLEDDLDVTPDGNLKIVIGGPDVAPIGTKENKE